MCSPKSGHNTPADLRREAVELQEKGVLMNGKSVTVDSFWLKVAGAVTVAVLLGIIAFGMDVYAFMSKGDRFTPAMHQESVEKAWSQARIEFVHDDVYRRDRAYLAERLDKIEAKLDKLLEAKN